MDDPKRARSRKRRLQPRIALPNVAPVLYSTWIFPLFNSINALYAKSGLDPSAVSIGCLEFTNSCGNI